MNKIMYKGSIALGIVILCVLVFYFYNIYSTSKNKNIVIAALAKSGSTYTTVKLANSLDYEIGSINQWKNIDYMKNFKNGNPKILKTHILPTKGNLGKLRRYTGDKIVVHVRDPRASILSAVYHAIESAEKIASGGVASAKPREIKFQQEYLGYTLEQKKEFIINDGFMYQIKWIRDWCMTKEIEDKKKNGFKIIITTYDEMITDEDNFFERFYKHFGIDKDDIKDVVIAKDKKVRFRSGNPNEWRTAFTQEQIARINEMLPEDLANRFGWEY